MNPHIEKEYKMMISEDIYDYYLKTLPLNTRVQINHYYSTNSKFIAIRTRLVDDKMAPDSISEELVKGIIDSKNVKNL